MSNQTEPLTQREAELQAVLSNNRHSTIQSLVWGTVIATIICSITWATCLYNMEAVKHPIEIQTKVESGTNVQRK